MLLWISSVSLAMCWCKMWFFSFLLWEDPYLIIWQCSDFHGFRSCLYSPLIPFIGIPFTLHYPGDFKYRNELNLWADGVFGIKCKEPMSNGLLGIKSNQFAVTFPLVKSIYRHFKGIRKLLKNFKQDLKANKPQVLRVTTKKGPFLFLPTRITVGHMHFCIMTPVCTSVPNAYWLGASVV